MPRSFARFLSNRHNEERDSLNDEYQAIFKDAPNNSRKRRSSGTPKTPGLTKSESNINKRYSFHYGDGEPSTDWRKSDDISIVVRREMEERLGEQLMPNQPISEDAVFSHTIWKVQMPDQSPVLQPNNDSDPKVAIIKAVAKPGKFCGRKPKMISESLAKLSLKDTLIHAEEPPKIEEPLKRRQVRQKGEKFTCSTCSRTFHHSWLLNAHMRVHTGERPFVCPEESCQKSFADRSNLRTHQRAMRHHNWQFQCGQCGKYFNQSFYLEHHSLASCRKYLMTAMHRKN